jgi:hypothetical protein
VDREITKNIVVIVSLLSAGDVTANFLDCRTTFVKMSVAFIIKSARMTLRQNGALSRQVESSEVGMAILRPLKMNAAYFLQSRTDPPSDTNTAHPIF